MKRAQVVIAFAAGLLGGMAGGVLIPGAVHAQAPAAPATPREIRAQGFTLVNDKGEVAGKIGFDAHGQPEIMLLDHGRVVWKAGGAGVLPARDE